MYVCMYEAYDHISPFSPEMGKVKIKVVINHRSLKV